MDSVYPDPPSVTMSTDPENRWLWKFPRQRMEAEQLHDSILAISGNLDVSLGGKTVPLRNRQFVFNHTSVDHTKYDSPRRAMYLPVIRNNLFTTFEQFDFPDPTMPSGHRASTTVAPQALLMMNATSVMDAALMMARQWTQQSSSDVSRVELGFQKILSRTPTPREIERSLAMIDRVTQHLTASASNNMELVDSPRILAWGVFCQSLMATNEFIFLR